jgi:alcohol dehydrogenase, propanol-preferring
MGRAFGLVCANLTRADGQAFMPVAAAVDLHPVVEAFPLAQANEALARLRHGTLQGAAVLISLGDHVSVAPLIG